MLKLSSLFFFFDNFQFFFFRSFNSWWGLCPRYFSYFRSPPLPSLIDFIVRHSFFTVAANGIRWCQSGVRLPLLPSLQRRPCPKVPPHRKNSSGRRPAQRTSSQRRRRFARNRRLSPTAPSQNQGPRSKASSPLLHPWRWLLLRVRFLSSLRRLPQVPSITSQRHWCLSRV